MEIVLLTVKLLTVNELTTNSGVLIKLAVIAFVSKLLVYIAIELMFEPCISGIAIVPSPSKKRIEEISKRCTVMTGAVNEETVAELVIKLLVVMFCDEIELVKSVFVVNVLPI